MPLQRRLFPVHCCTVVLRSAAGWEVKEQVAIAAMDCAANRFAFQLVEAIRNEFPHSKRADRLTVGFDYITLMP